MSFSDLGMFFSGVANFINNQMPWNRKIPDPEWLQSLLGDSPLLSRSEYDFISQVRRSIIEELRSRPNDSFNQLPHLTKKISVVRDNFEDVARYLQESAGRRNYFVQNYPSWRNCRDRSILQLINISKVVINNSKESASARGLGSTVSLAGGLICLVPGLGALRLAGGVLMGLGSLAAAGASIIEFQVLRQKIKEAEEIMLEDRAYSEMLWDWMSDSSHMQEAYNTVTSVDVNLKKIATDLYECFKMKSSTEHLNMLIQKIVIGKLKFFGCMADEIIEVIGMLLAIFMLYDRYRPLFNIVFEAYKCKRILCTAYNVTATAVKLASVAGVGQSSKLNPLPKFRFGIGIALDVISIINAAKDFEETSKEAIAIAEAAKKLQEEAKIYENLYDRVRRV